MSASIAAHYQNLIRFPSGRGLVDDVISVIGINEVIGCANPLFATPSDRVPETRNPPHVSARWVLTRAPNALRYSDNPTPSGHKTAVAIAFNTAMRCSCQLSRLDTIPFMNTS